MLAGPSRLYIFGMPPVFWPMLVRPARRTINGGNGAGRRRWGTRWRDHGAIVKKICYGRRWKRSSIWAIRWCGWRARSIGGFLDRRFASVCTPGPGQPGLPTRLVAGLFILKHTHNLSDEVLCARWLENPYYQFFCGELSFCHRLPFDRSSVTHWRQRLVEEQLVALIQESLSVAHKTGALATRGLERVVVDTTVQPKAIAHPTDARLCHRALEKLVDLARRNDVPLRQSYRRVAKRAAIMVGRYTHAHQFKRA